MIHRLTRTGLRRAAILLALALVPVEAYARQVSEVPIGRAVRDTDGDRVPDRMGDTVEVTGIITSDPVVIGPRASLTNLQDASGGVTLFSSDTTRLLHLKRGDQVRVRGVVSQYRGAEQLIPLQLSRVGTTRVPGPRDVAAADLLGERYSGQLVRLSGDLVAHEREKGRISVELVDGSGRVPVFVAGWYLSDPEFTRRLLRGGRVRVVGVATQRDRDPPYDAGYQLVPRGPQDFSFPFLPPFAGIAIAALLALLLAATVLRRRAQRHAREMEQLAAELRRSHESLEASERRFRTLIEHGHDILTLLDGDGVIRYLSPSVERVLGYTPDELIGRSALEMMHPEDAPQVATALRRGSQHRDCTLSLQYRFRHRDGSWRWLESTGRNALHDPAVQGAIINSRDVTERKEAEATLHAYAEELRALSLTDPLTGLCNRRGFFTLAEHECKLAHRMGKSLALVFLDLDGLKGINDTLGHAAGDRALLEMARVLRATFRESDILGRVGGDEFAVLAWTDGSGSPGEPARRLEERLRARSAKADLPFPLSASVGVVEVDASSTGTLDELLSRADARMYEAKRLRAELTAGQPGA